MVPVVDPGGGPIELTINRSLDFTPVGCILEGQAANRIGRPRKSFYFGTGKSAMVGGRSEP
jgi:hypothetical protein